MSLILVHDTETTGFSERDDHVTEYAAIAFDTVLKVPVGFLSVLINHGIDIPPKITELTGITREMLEKYGVSKEMAVKRILKFYERYEIDFIMAHNEPFDRKMTKALLNGYEPVCNRICTQRDFDHAGAPNKKLPTLSEHYGIEHGFAHRAMTDVMACLGVAIKGGLYEFLERPIEPKVEIRIKVPYGMNDTAKDMGFYWSGNNVTKHHYRQVPKRKLDEVLKLVSDKKWPIIETIEF